MATELAHRCEDGVDVRLFWNRAAGRVSVAVAVPDTGEAFELDVRGSERPRRRSGIRSRSLRCGRSTPAASGLSAAAVRRLHEHTVGNPLYAAHC
jgi:hypothetical protein